MESAIDTHLVCPRSISRRVPDDYQPPFSMFVGRADQKIKQVTMAYLGVQSKGAERRADALAAVTTLVSSVEGPDGAGHYDITHHVDNQGYDNYIVVGYWDDPDVFGRWLDSADVEQWWSSEDRLSEPVGYFREVVAPRVDQLETLYAFTDELPGVGQLMNDISGDINEHGYWGSMRERIPLSQTSWMQPAGEDVLRIVSGDPAAGGRVVVAGHDNIALIRSGQDWREAGEQERALYLDEIQPTLQQGMDFLRDHGAEHGCYSNRLVQNIDIDGNPLDETYNIGHWRSLEKLERWAESHPTHLRIFTTFFKVVANLDKLRLYHEVSVSDTSDQIFEYINCHPATGLMRDAQPA
ncbi:phenylacetaldoxime dehydratase family protein [Gordonia polyisoprenivorans]|uniref:aliphatic aldoxime dehydratase n=1 Tax=Gordonia polyisoprenivorans TaxID=84595 RepID=UPI001AD73D80|nr:phenylacetaldoxime dehydratase family protein [Gordonia polyisoprenivorans]QTI69077.1 phenylacetaldoxime dehydratase family protein [Gordonia polyisoprenivorans]QTI69089.1 phenylacetaldoxime dehydratase family protein [Gordonia polyisoprenivorans]